MADFCACGSLVLAGSCTNKNCSLNKGESEKKAKKVLKASSKSRASKTSEAKSNNSRRASKCITYNLYDIKKEEDAEN